ncbi:MAG: nitronate monooxygenase [Chloroflexi bacterium]|nr:nitronate monooxygenase [Chloroflexota bacterium]
MFRTKLCDLLGIEYPIILASMGHYPPGPLLASAVSNAGGLGLLGGGTAGADELAEVIRTTRRLTDRPFGVGLIFPARAGEADSGWKLPNPLPEPIVKAREELRARGVVVDETPPLPETDGHAGWRLHQHRAEVALEERVAVLVCGLGTPEWVIREAHQRDIKIISLVGSVKNARRVAAMGADVIVAQGHENGGHVGIITLFSLLPQVVEAVNVPVVAAGGIVDGRGLVAALALGASGVYVGTRFLATHESEAPKWHKQAVLDADENGTIYNHLRDGMGHRHIRTCFDGLWEGHEHEMLPFPHQIALVENIFKAARAANIPDFAEMSADQSVAMIKELKTVQDVVNDMIAEATAILTRRLPTEVRLA